MSFARLGANNGNFSHGAWVGGKATPERRAYNNAKQRCTNPNNDRYEDWGGRGIEFRFSNYKEFLAELGTKPEPQELYSLDRKNNDGHYEVGNVKWSTREEQRANSRPRPVGYRDNAGKFSTQEVVCR